MKKQFQYISVSISFLFAICLLQFSCKKYLEERSNKSFVIPTSVKQIQALLDGANMYSEYPLTAELASDNYYFFSNDWSSIPNIDDRNTYIWEPNTNRSADWAVAYTRIFTANVALAVLDTLIDGESSISEFNNAKGQALFYRASDFFHLAQVFAPQYSTESASSGYGIPLKTSPNINEKTVRSTVEETYLQIISDLKTAIPLLPNIQPDSTYKTRPSKAAAWAQLARTYLVMGKYEDASSAADSSLSYYNILYNFASFGTIGNTTNPFKVFNKEVIYHAQARFLTRLTSTKIDSTLFLSYSTNDIRRAAFFRSNGDGTYRFKGNYTGSSSNSTLFAGISTNEVYLIKAEANARIGNIAKAMDVLNLLLQTRWKNNGTFTPEVANDQNEAITKILIERRKELICRPGLRWSDLRRLNLEPTRAITIKRIINSQSYELQPNEKRYTFLIPISVVEISGITQNPR